MIDGTLYTIYEQYCTTACRGEADDPEQKYNPKEENGNGGVFYTPGLVKSGKFGQLPKAAGSPPIWTH